MGRCHRMLGMGKRKDRFSLDCSLIERDSSFSLRRKMQGASARRSRWNFQRCWEYSLLVSTDSLYSFRGDFFHLQSQTMFVVLRQSDLGERVLVNGVKKREPPLLFVKKNKRRPTWITRNDFHAERLKLSNWLPSSFKYENREMFVSTQSWTTSLKDLQTLERERRYSSSSTRRSRAATKKERKITFFVHAQEHFAFFSYYGSIFFSSVLSSSISI